MADVDMTDAPGTAIAKKGNDGDTKASDGKKRFEVKKVSKSDSPCRARAYKRLQWNAVALWAWDIVVDNCAICRNHIMDLCELSRTGRVFYAFRKILISSRHRVPSKPSLCHQRGVHRGLGNMQCWFTQLYPSSQPLTGDAARFPLPLHLPLA